MGTMQDADRHLIVISETLDAEIKSHIIQTTADQKVRKMGLKDDRLTLNDLLVAGRSNEFALAQSSEMEKDPHVANQVQSRERSYRGNSRGRSYGLAVTTQHVIHAAKGIHMKMDPKVALCMVKTVMQAGVKTTLRSSAKQSEGVAVVPVVVPVRV